ncbi:MAG TPA: ABC transporter permease [Longimicrobium sp.]|nr:ABC transporter permease [Longimicrobium sp.]
MRDSVELTLARLAFRQLAGSRRSLWVLALALLPVLLSLLFSGNPGPNDDVTEDYGELYQALIVGVLLPIVSLVVGTSVFGAEVDDGTITYVLGKPVPRWRIVLTRVVVAGLATAMVVAPSAYISGVIALRSQPSAPRVALGMAGAVIAGSFLYCALFVAISLSTRRALVAGLAYVVVWESSLSNTFGGTRALSVRQYTQTFAQSWAGLEASVLNARLELGTALTMAAVVAVLATIHSIRRLQRFEIGEAV